MSTVNTSRIRSAIERLTPKQRQYAALAAIMACGVGALWAVFAFTGNGIKSGPNPQPSSASATATNGAVPTNIGVMAPGQQVNPLDQWVGTAGRKLAQYENEREEQSRINRDRKDFEDKTMQRFGALEKRLTATAETKPAAAPTGLPTPPLPAAPATPATSQPSAPGTYPPANALPANLPPPSRRTTPSDAISTGIPAELPETTTGLVHVSMASPGKPAIPRASSAGPSHDDASHAETIETYLPVSFTRGTLLGGLDAPTGGQSQSNPHPVLIRLSDNSVLPNRVRAEYKECFVIAAGYGDISSERAYLRTENLSCVRADGSTLEVRIQGSVYGEDGKVGMRGRLVTKQGQMLANALLAGLVSGMGQGLATSSTSTSTSALGTIASTSGAAAYRAGIGSGVGSALDRLAQYYIKLAEQTFPVIEIDAGREIDVVITKGVRIDAPVVSSARSGSALASLRHSSNESYPKDTNDEND